MDRFFFIRKRNRSKTMPFKRAVQLDFLLVTRASFLLFVSSLVHFLLLLFFFFLPSFFFLSSFCFPSLSIDVPGKLSGRQCRRWLIIFFLKFYSFFSLFFQLICPVSSYRVLPDITGFCLLLLGLI